MCGIAGAYRKPDDQLPDSEDRDAALKLLAHRGPETSGSWTDAAGRAWLGHRRLAIIDLDERANQPFLRDGLALTFNGEIYNYQELREELSRKYELRTGSDTEAVLLLYKEYGPACLDRMIGMFAFAIFDERTGELFCARDRVGEKPFVYSETGRGFAFASEIPALHATGMLPRAVDEDGAWERLYGIRSMRRIPEPFSTWQHVRKLPPASWLKVRDGAVVERGTYWHLKPATDRSVTPAQVRETVVRAIERASVADVPVSVLLSGGVDSTIIAGVMARELGRPVTGYAFGNDADDPEIARARDAAAEYGIPLREFYFGDTDIQAELRDLIRTYGEPFYLAQLGYASVLFRAIREDGTKVVLGGNGADELFSGYVSHGRTRLASLALKAAGVSDAWPLKRKRLLRGAADAGPALDEVYDGVAHLMDPFRKRPLLDLAGMFALLVENAHSITFLGDLAGMRHAVELRSPFLDKDVVELAMRIPMRYKLPRPWDRSGAYGKDILRRAFADLVPERILRRPKMGFGYAIPEGAGLGGDTEAFAAWSLAEWRKLYGN